MIKNPEIGYDFLVLEHKIMKMAQTVLNDNQKVELFNAIVNTMEFGIERASLLIKNEVVAIIIDLIEREHNKLYDEIAEEDCIIKARE